MWDSGQETPADGQLEKTGTIRNAASGWFCSMASVLQGWEGGDIRARGESLAVSGTQGAEGQGGGVRLKPATRAWPWLSRHIHSRPENPHRKAVGATKASRRGSITQEQADHTVPADTTLLRLLFDPEQPPEMGGTANQQPWGVLPPSPPDGPRGAGGHC